MNAQIEKVIAIAERELGVKESPPNSNNVKYNTWFYGREVSGSAYPWCACWVSWVFCQSGLSHLFHDGKKTASCDAIYYYALSTERFVKPEDLRRGDIVLYKFGDAKNKRTDHTGIVTSVTAKSILAAEANTSAGNDSDGGAVMLRYRPYTNIVGGYRPLYEEDEMSYEDWVRFAKRFEEESAKPKGGAPSVWATKATDWAVENGLFTGDENGDFDWQGNITREQAAAVMYRFYQSLEKRGVV